MGVGFRCLGWLRLVEFRGVTVVVSWGIAFFVFVRGFCLDVVFSFRIVLFFFLWVVFSFSGACETLAGR